MREGQVKPRPWGRESSGTRREACHLNANETRSDGTCFHRNEPRTQQNGDKLLPNQMPNTHWGDSY